MLEEYLCGETAVLIRPVGGEPSLSHNADKPFRSASVIKLFILSYCIESGADESAVLKVNPRDRVGNSVLSELKSSSVTVGDAMTFMIASSDNTATNLLIRESGMDAINAYIKSIGCRGTVISRKMMDFAAAERGQENYTTLSDCYTVMTRLMKSDRAKEILSAQKDRERLMRYIFGGVAGYTKSGDIPGVFNDVGVIAAGGKEVFAGVLTDGLDRAAAKRLCGKVGLAACGACSPVTGREAELG